MDKQYRHENTESIIYKKWEDSKAFSPSKAKDTFTILMPPPNANDPLHIGHARFVSIQDTLIRFERMRGKSVLWLPGADHAGIETQFVFEKKLREKGKSRFDYDRNEFYKMIWDYVHKNSDLMINQLKRLGASCDWTRFKFTLDPEIVKEVTKTFSELYKDGLVYRGLALVNYCTHCGTAFSNLEVNHIEKVDPLYYVKYLLADGSGEITVATVRPEPIFADTHLAVNPKDPGRNQLIGKFVLNPITDKKMEIIGDAFVDPEFGTGIVKLTPAHDFDDFQVAKKHGLPIIQAIGTDGKIVESGGEIAGMYASQARKKTAEILEEKGLIEKIDKNYKHTIGVCYRCKRPIEPLPLEQWFVKASELAKNVDKSIKEKKVVFAAPKYKKIAKHWLDNIEDWNISRQIVWGIQIPAWKCDDCGEWTVTSGNTPKKCACGSTKLTQDPDTFDTWFSSGQWPFVTLKTTREQDFKKFYPTDVMETGYDILFFWVLRMLMLGLYKTGKVPFKSVLLHGLVRDKMGQKISKSKGNVIDPIDMADKYGADALRMGLLWGSLIENDVSLSEDNIRGQRNFANKIWNIARFISMDSNNKGVINKPNSKDKNDLKILKKLEKTAKSITQKLEQYRLSEAAEALYDFIWKDFASDYLESTKDRKEKALPTLKFVLQESLKLAHPFMPFLTENIWNEMFDDKSQLITKKWPQV